MTVIAKSAKIHPAAKNVLAEKSLLYEIIQYVQKNPKFDFGGIYMDSFKVDHSPSYRRFGDF